MMRRLEIVSAEVPVWEYEETDLSDFETSLPSAWISTHVQLDEAEKVFEQIQDAWALGEPVVVSFYDIKNEQRNVQLTRIKKVETSQGVVLRLTARVHIGFS